MNIDNNVDTFIEDLINALNPKQRRVLKERYGINGKKKTLQEIGNSLSITRERVRQIEGQGLKKIKDDIVTNFSHLIETAKKHLESQNGVREDRVFINELADLAGLDTRNKNWDAKVRLLLFSAGTPLFSRENPDLKAYWFINENSKKIFLNFIEKTIKFFETSDKSKIIEEKTFLNKIKNTPEYHLLFISKKFSANPFGDVGLVKWPEIKPKNVRDKAYLALKKNNTPLHFRDIAKNITKIGISNKQVNTQTVHNELIKDKRFVLVGRGVYALRENGYETGTVKDVIASLIKENGPLGSNDVITLVNQKRLLKENTILLNLQNRKNFRRLEDGRYTIYQA